MEIHNHDIHPCKLTTYIITVAHTLDKTEIIQIWFLATLNYTMKTEQNVKSKNFMAQYYAITIPCMLMYV